jgi:hypothetical protein
LPVGECSTILRLLIDDHHLSPSSSILLLKIFMYTPKNAQGLR